MAHFDRDDRDARIPRHDGRFSALLGNLQEWTGYRPYPCRPDDGREEAAAGADRVTRGASHDVPPTALRVTSRRHSIV